MTAAVLFTLRIGPCAAAVAATLLLAALQPPAALAAAAPGVELAAPFADGAVLQRGMPVPVWGWSQPGTAVTVEFAGQTQTATAGADGRWTATLAPLQASAEPRELTVRDASGASRTLANILVGEVWLASGQSNMQWPASKSDGQLLVEQVAAEAAAAGRPLPPIREWAVDDVFAALHPVEHARGTWKTDAFGNYSAVAFAFAHALYAELGVPIGILNCSFSQTSIEAWTPRGAFAAGTDPHSRDLHRRVLETDPTTPEHAAAWKAFYASIDEALAADAARMQRGEPARGIPTETPGNLRGNRDASWLFNARIAPAVPYAIRGCIWNQGYANINGGLTYYDNLHALVRGWRQAWGRPELPVYFHQFYCPKPQVPAEPDIGPMAEMRLGTWLARDIPHTGMASQIDVEGAIHYRHKTVPGRRLARHALARQYGKDIVADGPMYKGYTVAGEKLIVEFDHAAGGLVVGETGSNAVGRQPGATGFSDPTVIENGAGRVKLFHLADEHRVWHPAEVAIDGTKVILTAPGVKSPRGVCYGTSGVGFQPNLYNRALLPLTPFIVFDHELVTSRNWPDVPLKVAGVEPDLSEVGLAYEYRKLPLLAASFRDHAVLQADQPVTIWGSCVHDRGYEAKGKAEVRCRFSGPDIETVEKTIPVGGGMREWRLTLPAMAASAEPKSLEVSFSIDGETVHERKCTGIAIGDVWYVAASGQPQEAETGSGPVRVFARKAKRATHGVPSRYSLSVSTAPDNRFESQWRDVAGGPAAEFGRRLHERSGRPVGLVWMAGPDLDVASWIGSDQLAAAPSLRADFENLAATRPGNPFYEANARRYVAAWKAYWGDYVPALVARKRPPDAAAWGSYPTLAAGVTSAASGGFNVMVAPFADSAFKGLVFLGGPATVKADGGATYAEQVAALAASWRATFGGTPAFYYALPTAKLAAKITAPAAIAAPAVAVPVDAWDESAAVAKVLDAIAAPPGRPAAAVRRPNFLFVIADDHRWDAMGAVQREQGERARFPWFETPALDRLAAGGVRFRNAFVTHSICSPGRAGFLTGQYTHVNGVMDNHSPFPVAAVTHATLLRDAGYRTAYFGKWHMGEQTGRRPGFDHSASFIGQGRYQDCPFEVDGVVTPTTGWVDDVSTDLAIEWLKRGPGGPFSVVVGFKSPHNRRGGENLPPRLRGLYEGRTTRPTPNCEIAAVYHPAAAAADAGRERGLAANAVHLDYLRHVKGIDENLGRLLDALDELGLADDTVVVYSSDNGFFLGERGLGDKRALYEESLRVPLIVRYPRLFPAGRAVDELVLNIDLAPSYLDLAGLPPHPGMQGASWQPLARGAAPAGWRDSFLAYYRKELGDTPTCHGVRTADAKLIVYPQHPEWTEVYDLRNDPYELRRLPADGPLALRLREELAERMQEVGFAP